MSANENQVGGNHYHADIQHWDMVEDNGIGYLEACATKYVTRWRKKDGLKDLGKASHYVIKLQEKGRPARGEVSAEALAEYCLANDLNDLETEIVGRLCGNWNAEDLEISLGLIAELVLTAPDEDDPVQAMASAVINICNDNDIQTTLTVLSNVAGQCLVAFGNNVPALVHENVANFNETVQIVANRKMLYDAETKGNS